MKSKQSGQKKSMGRRAALRGLAAGIPRWVTSEGAVSAEAIQIPTESRRIGNISRYAKLARRAGFMISKVCTERIVPVLVTVEVVLCACAFFAAAQRAGFAASGLSNPYHSVDNWAKLPAGRKMGELGSVAVDSKGDIWTIERCGADTCAGSKLAPILEFDPSGKLLKSFGAGLLIFPHSLYVDSGDSVWVADEQAANEKELAAYPDAKGKGIAVVKFSPEGKVLMTLGTPGVAGDPPNAFMRASSVLVSPKGDIFVADGDPDDSGKNARIVKFSKDGKFVKAWGKRGSSPGEFNTPHSLAMDSKGRLFVADRDNNRIQIFNQDGKFLEEWKQFGNPTGIFIDANDTLYVSDTQSDEKVNPGFTRGIRIGSTKDGVVKALIPALGQEGKDHLGRSFAGAEGVAVDATGNIYAAESRAGLLRKYVKVQ